MNHKKMNARWTLERCRLGAHLRMVCSTRDEPNLSAPPPRQSTATVPNNCVNTPIGLAFDSLVRTNANRQSSIVNRQSFRDFYVQYELLPRALELFQDNECRLPQRPVRLTVSKLRVWRWCGLEFGMPRSRVKRHQIPFPIW
jgi:hypothetical protein